MMEVLIKRDRQTQKTDAEKSTIYKLRKAKDGWQTPAPGRIRKGFSPRAPRENTALGTPQFQTFGSKTITGIHSSIVLSFSTLLQQSQETTIFFTHRGYGSRCPADA